MPAEPVPPARAHNLDLPHRLGLLGAWRLERDTDEAGWQTEIDALSPHEREKVCQIARRRLAFQLLFEIDARAQAAPSEDAHEPPDALVRSTLEHVDGLGPLDAQRVADLALDAWNHRSRADAEFARLAPEWPAHRMAGVDRAILRLGHCELAHTMTPAPIVISECVELARAYSTEKSPAFVNALLDKSAQRIASERTQAEKDR